MAKWLMRNGINVAAAATKASGENLADMAISALSVMAPSAIWLAWRRKYQ